MKEDDWLDTWKCVDCGKPLIDCPGQGKSIEVIDDGYIQQVIICEPCSVRREISNFSIGNNMKKLVVFLAICCALLSTPLYAASLSTTICPGAGCFNIPTGDAGTAGI